MAMFIEYNLKELKDDNKRLFEIGDRVAYTVSGWYKPLKTGTIRGFHTEMDQIFVMNLSPNNLDKNLVFTPNNTVSNTYVNSDNMMIINGVEDIFRDMTKQQVYEMCMNIQKAAAAAEKIRLDKIRVENEQQQAALDKKYKRSKV